MPSRRPGYPVPDVAVSEARAAAAANFTWQILTLFGMVFGAVLLFVVVGEGLGVFESLTDLVPWPIGAVLVLAAGYPIFRKVVRATFRGQVISHTLMSIGAFAALAVGQWATAVVVVFFMRVGDYAERFTTERARRAVKNLTALAPQMARIEHDGSEHEVPIGAVQVGDMVIVRPGEQISVDGEVITGRPPWIRPRSPARQCRSRLALGQTCSPRQSHAWGACACGLPMLAPTPPSAA